MKKIFILFAAICAAAAVSCTPKELAIDTPAEEGVSDVKLIPITITASLEGTKADMVDVKWTWQSGDKLAVYDGTDKREFTLDESAAGTAVAKFTGEVAETFTSLQAVFPYAAAGDSFGTPLIPAVQTVASGTIDPKAMIAVAERAEQVADDEFNFYFTSGVSMLRFTVPDGVQKVILHTEGKEAAIAGENRSVTVNVPGAGQYWAAVNPAAYEGMKVFARTSNGDFLKSTASTIDLSAPGKAKNLGTLGTGTQVSVIEDGAELVSYLGSTPTLDAYVVNDLDLTGKTVTTCASFANVFDGLYHTISNWVASNALFATNAGSVKNIIVDNSCSISWTNAVTDGLGISFIVAKDHTGSVENCEVAGSITVNSSSAGRIYCAGIVGEATTGTVSGCKFSGIIDVTLSGTSASCSAIAGVVGRFGKVTDTANKVMVSDCENTGSIKFLFSGASGNMKKFGIGGVVGQSVSIANAENDYGIVQNCVNRGNIEWSYPGGGSGSYPALGGVAGIVEGQIKSCSNYGKLKYTGSKTKAATDASIGGVAGYVTLGAKDCHNYGIIELDAAFAGGTAMAQSGGNTTCSAFGGVFGGAGEYASGEILSTDSSKQFTPPTSTTVLIENCTNEKALSFTPVMVSSGAPKFIFGGVVGACTAHLKDCCNNADISIVSQPKWILAGGVAGVATGNITSCSNNGILDVDSDKNNHTADATQQHFVGGIAGYIWKGNTINDCHNTKAISLYNVVTTVGSLSYLGGLVGSYNGSNTMTDCSNSGDITFTADNPICIGGIAGGFNGTMKTTSNSGKVENVNNYTSAGKESEIGGLIGYVNAVITDCENTGIVVNAAEDGFAGGLCGGAGATARTWSGCTVSGAVSGAATKGSVLGRFRNSGTTAITLGTADKPVTISGTASSLPLCGKLNGNTITETNVVIE
jgi:hypothetical protein